MTQDVYLNAFGAFLPGEPLDSEAAEQRLGWVGERKSPTRLAISASDPKRILSLPPQPRASTLSKGMRRTSEDWPMSS